MSLGDHLRAYQQIDLARVQRVQHVLHVVTAANGIAIQVVQCALAGTCVQNVFQLFGARAQILYKLAAALRTRLRRGPQETAVVADQPVIQLVIGHRNEQFLHCTVSPHSRQRTKDE